MLGDWKPPLAINWVWAHAGRQRLEHHRIRAKMLLLIA
jgi:hypothetical protein